MKTILVTGAAGYIGRHVVKNALDRGYRVIASDFAFKGLDERAEFCDVPIFSGDPDIFRKLGSPDICIHLAWRDGFRHNSAAHMRDLSSHVIFLNHMAEGGLRSLSVMGTMHEVGYWEGPINESTPCKPQSQYGIAKNALRQSLMLSLEDSACRLHWLRARTISPATRRTAVRSLPNWPRRKKRGRKRSPLPAAKICMTLLMWMNWPI